MPTLPWVTWILFGATLFGVVGMLIEIFCLYAVTRRELPTPKEWPSFSIIKPLAGLDDELLENLKSHLEIGDPGEYEVLLGVKSEQDLAYPVARDFARAHPEKVKLVLQEGEPGHNPKVNQLITLTRAARFDFIALTDSNVRVRPNYLREHAAMLLDPKVGISSNLFVGTGEKRLGALFDNMTLVSFCAANLAAGEMVLKMSQVVGKSLVIRREVLARVGGWHEVKDVLAEDSVLAQILGKMGLRARLCPSTVMNVQVNQRLRQFWDRHSRWSMIRFRVLMPGTLLEPLLTPIVPSTVGAVFAWHEPLAWAFVAFCVLFGIAFVQVCAIISRGYGFKPHQLLLVPLRDVLFFATWVAGAFKRRVVWRGNRLLVLARTRLAEPDAFERVRKMQRMGR